MEKKRYYVTVHSESILTNQENADFDFEIDATDEDVEKLRDLFGHVSDSDNNTFLRAHAPVIPHSYDIGSDLYDEYLREVYRTIHGLGTDSTKQHIESMGILN